MKFTVVGMGYVGLSLSILIAQKYKVSVTDIDEKKINLINKKKSPIKDREITAYLLNKKLKLSGIFNSHDSYVDSDYVIICTPTNYDSLNDKFDTTSVEQVIKDVLKYNSKINIVVKSTIPIGFIDRMRKKFNNNNIFFSPEFLRENQALYDNLYPSRIIVGDKSKSSMNFAKILAECSNLESKKIIILQVAPKEAEAIKLFSNTYLAMRVSFFNELDSYCESHNLLSHNVIKGVSLDPRIGDYYNNPSFGYGGYCLPKDTKQLLKNFDKIPNKIIKAVVEANNVRKEFIVNSIIRKKPNIVGVYRLIMKNNSDNFRESATIDIIHKLVQKKIQVIIYEPLDTNFKLKGTKLLNNLKEFKDKSDLIIANRMTKDLKSHSQKVYTRDIFFNN